MHDRLRGPDGNILEVWHCPDCNTHAYLHPDPDHSSNHWMRQEFLPEHEYVHRQQLKMDHDGDRGMLRLALKYPALHAAIIQVQGPAADLAPEHRAHILRTAGIKDEEGEI